MNDYLKYKYYCGSIDIDMEANLLHGRLLFIKDVVTYEGNNPEELENAFKVAVDDYISTCNELDREPHKPFSGTFNVRVGQELHKKASHKAVIDERFQSLNDLVKYALNQFVAEEGEHTVHHVYHIEALQRKEFTVPNLIGSEERNEWRIEPIASKNPH